MEKVRATIGIVAGIFDTSGKLMLTRRTQHDSINNVDYAGNWELPVVAVMESDMSSVPYDYLSLELVRGVQEKLGIKINVAKMPPLYSVMFKGPKGYDLAMITPVYPNNVSALVPGQDINGEVLMVSPRELNELARDFISLTDAKAQGLKDAKGLLSGFGRRQHCMALIIFQKYSQDNEYKNVASDTLDDIQSSW